MNEGLQLTINFGFKHIKVNKIEYSTHTHNENVTS